MRIRWRLALKLLTLVGLLALTEALPLVETDFFPRFAWLQPLLRFATLILGLNVAFSLFRATYRRRKDLVAGTDDALLLGLRNVYYIITAFVVFGGLITLYGLDFQTIFTSLSIIAAAIAIVTRDFIVEIISGLIMSLSGQVNVGDYVSIDETKGRVTTLTLTKTVLLTEDEDLVYVPNSKLFGEELVNYTQRMQRRVSIEFEVGLTALRSVDELERDLEGALAEYEPEIVPGSYSLRVVELHKDYAAFKFRYTLREQDGGKATERDSRRRTARRVIDYVNSAGSAASVQRPGAPGK